MLVETWPGMHRFAFATLLLAAACGDDSASGPTELKSDLARDTAPDVSDAELAAQVAGNTEFAADLYRAAAIAQAGKNLFMSPHSVSTAIAMTYAGATGTTATQIADVFHFVGPAATVHATFDALDLQLAARAQGGTSQTIPFKLTTANSIWGQEGKAFQPTFLDTLAVNYGAGLHVLDFAGDPEASRGTINGWVEDQTNDKIKNLLPEGSVTGDTKLVLTNAIYFTAAWASPFSPTNTADRPFQVAGSAVQVPTLFGESEMNYASGADFAAAEIPYDGGQLSMTVVVPTGDLAAFEASLSASKFASIVDAMRLKSVKLTLPKFKFDSPIGLRDILFDLGMTDAFTFGAADFSGIDGTTELAITDVLHKGFVAIDEKGTEAAAATAVIIGDTSVPEQAELVADRPFVFFIRDLPTGEILFVGRIVDPR